MKGRVIVGIVLAAGMATPAVAAADKGGIPSQDKGNVPSCGYGVGGNSAGASNHVAYTELPQTFACTGGNSASGSYANGHNGSNGKAHAAQAGTIRLGPYREKDLERTFVNHDVDNS